MIEDKESENIDRELAEIKMRLSAIERKLLRVNFKPLDAIGRVV